MDEPLTFPVEARDEAVAVVHAAGELDVLSAPALSSALAAAAGTACPLVEVDLGEVGFLDSTALTALLVAAHDLRRAERSLRITNVPQRIERVLEIAGVRDLL